MSIDVFISYSTKDAVAAKAACAGLEAAKIRCWMAPRDIIAGAKWGSSIVHAINECSVMVLIFSGNANDSAQVQREVDQAFSKSKTVVPLRIEDVKPADDLAYYLNTVHWLDALTPPLERNLEKLVATVEALLPTAKAARLSDKTIIDETAAARAQDEARAKDARHERQSDGDWDLELTTGDKVGVPEARRHSGDPETRQRTEAVDRIQRETEVGGRPHDEPPDREAATMGFLADGRVRFAAGGAMITVGLVLSVIGVMLMHAVNESHILIATIGFTFFLIPVPIGLATMHGGNKLKWVSIVGQLLLVFALGFFIFLIATANDIGLALGWEYFFTALLVVAMILSIGAALRGWNERPEASLLTRNWSGSNLAAAAFLITGPYLAVFLLWYLNRYGGLYLANWFLGVSILIYVVSLSIILICWKFWVGNNRLVR